MLWKNDRAILPVEHESLKSIRDFIDEIRLLAQLEQ